MRIFRPMSDISTKTLLDWISRCFLIMFGLGFFLGAFLFGLLKEPQRDFEVVIASVIVLIILLLTNMLMRKRIIPELERRYKKD